MCSVSSPNPLLATGCLGECGEIISDTAEAAETCAAIRSSVSDRDVEEGHALFLPVSELLGFRNLGTGGLAELRSGLFEVVFAPCKKLLLPELLPIRGEAAHQRKLKAT
jgi:hypothetical protein